MTINSLSYICRNKGQETQSLIEKEKNYRTYWKYVAYINITWRMVTGFQNNMNLDF